jgi:hypothetical protein
VDYISKLTDEELRVICDLIPVRHFREAFKMSPKRFNRLSKYRPEKVPLSEIKRIVVNRGSDPFMSDLLNFSIQMLLDIMHKQTSLFTDAGNDAHTALLRALPKSDFREHMDLYFKLSGDTYSPEYAALVQSAIVEIEAKGKIVDAAEAEAAQDEGSSAELEHLRSALAEAQQNLAQERENHTSLQAQYSAAKEQIEESEQKLAELQRLASYADSSAEISTDKNLPYTSLCCVGMPSGNSLELFRIADIVDGLIQTQRQDGSPQRDILYTKDRSKQKNQVGIWAWRTEPNYNPGRLDYIVSEFLPAHTPVQIIVIPDCRTVEDLKACLCQGIAYAPDGERTLYAVTADGEYTGLLCGRADITEKNGIVTLKPSVTKLPLYKFHEQEIIKVREWSFFYRIHLGVPMKLLQIRDPLETVKELVLQRSPIAKLKDWGTIREARGFRSFLQGLPATDFLQEIAELCSCSLEEAKNYVNEFIQHAEEYLQGTDVESTLLCTALECSSALTEKCRALNEEKWRLEHALLLKQVQEELTKVTDETQQQRELHDRLVMEQQRMKERQDTLTAEIAQQEQLAADVEGQVAARITMAREKAADFICEMAFHSPAAVTLPTPASQNRFVPGKKLDTDIREHHEAYDAVCTLQDELEEAGVIERCASMLAAFLYTAHILHTPLLLAGPNGRDIADAVSAALFGRTASVFRCESAYDPSAVEEYMVEGSQVITLLDPINTRWISHIPELTTGRDKLILAVHPFAEDLLIEPRGLYNYVVPVLTELFVDRPASGKYVGGCFGADFREYECAKPQKKLHLARKLPMPAMLRNWLQQMLADMKAILGKDIPDFDVLFAALPYAYVTGQTDMILEGIEDGGGLSKDTQTLLRTFLGELQ